MERRVLVAIFLSFIVLYLYQAFVAKPVPKPADVVATDTTAPPPASTTKPSEGGTATTGASSPALPAAAPLVGASSEQDVRVETQDVTAVFTNRGARLKSYRLKHYFDQSHAPQELVPGDGSPAQPFPFSLRASDERVTSTLNSALYAVAGAPIASTVVTAQTAIRFEYRDSAGLHAVKEFHLAPASYILEFQCTVTQNDAAVPTSMDWGPAVGDLGENSRFTRKAEGLIFQDGKAVRLAAKDIAKQPVRQGDFHYAGVDDNYFMAVALFPGVASVTYRTVSLPPPAGSTDPPRDLVAFSIEGAGGPQKFFAGPKDFDLLMSIDRDVARAIDFGMFSILVVPLLRSLKWVNSYIGNYGWSIIILTIIINVIMFPLRHKSVVSMRKMQEIQPEAKAIQDRYAKLKATDPAKQKMNQELMTLYRERGVNPASGCVPMLLTMPVLLAMWALLSTSIELRGAPWMGWIHDLSTHDPFYITPLLMGASQVWQQRITPAAGADPAQQKMMMFMPVMFTVMFLWLPAGVAIYYAVSNLWGIGQQYLTNYLIGPPKVRTVRPPAERRVKRPAGAAGEAAPREN